nr:hypothetical protein [Tanacetum cinerariifolium]
MLVTQCKGSGTLTEPHHTPSPEAQQSPQHNSSSSSHPTASTKTIPTIIPIEIPTLRQYFRRATWIAQSKALLTVADEPASLLRDVSQGEAFPSVTGLEAGQDRENIIKTSDMPHDSTPRVTSLDADEGNLEISSLKARIKLLKDKDIGSVELSRDDAPIKGRSIEIREEARVEKSTERGSNDTKEMVNVLTFMDAANILTSGVQAISVTPVAEVSTIGVPTGSSLVPTVSAIFTTASVVTPYSRRPREISAKDKGNEKMVKSDTPKKKKLQEQIDVQMAREMEEEIARDAQRMNEHITRDAEIARIHAKEELQMMIYGLDRSNEMISKHLHEYEQTAAELTIGEKIELINELCPRFFGVFVTNLTTGRLIDGSSCDGIDMVIKNLDFEPKIDAVMRDFLEPKSMEKASVLPQSDGVGLKRHHIVPFGEFNGVPIALVARSWRRRQKLLQTPSGMKSDGINSKCDGIIIADKEAHERFDGLTASGNPSDTVRTDFPYI